MKRQQYHNVGNTNGRDIKCRVCKEPYENIYVLEDFTDKEWKSYVLLGSQLDDPCGEPTRISALQGCPCCHGFKLSGDETDYCGIVYI